MKIRIAALCIVLLLIVGFMAASGGTAVQAAVPFLTPSGAGANAGMTLPTITASSPTVRATTAPESTAEATPDCSQAGILMEDGYYYLQETPPVLVVISESSQPIIEGKFAVGILYYYFNENGTANLTVLDQTESPEEGDMAFLQISLEDGSRARFYVTRCGGELYFYIGDVATPIAMTPSATPFPA